ncbi:MAG: class I SAM-dependent methyltransferase [Hyphomicrobiaceae bacterium]|nr:class I SAM-dependent methyltransferase [Hyphomicrobiaceae bacterium]
MSESESSAAEIYERYMGSAIADPFTVVLLQYASPNPSDRVLDLAAGTGSVARHVAPLVGVEGRAVALDINPDMLAVGRATLPVPAGAPIEWREGDALNLDLPDQAFDLVLCQQGLQFFSDRAAALRETRRVLNGAGRAVFSVWRDLDLHPVYKALFEATARHLAADISDFDVSFSLGDADELEALLREAGFERVDVAPRQLDVRLPSPERFVQLTVAGAATSVPAFIHMSPEARPKLVEAIGEELGPLISSYSAGGELVFPMSTHIVLAT